MLLFYYNEGIIYFLYKKYENKFTEILIVSQCLHYELNSTILASFILTSPTSPRSRAGHFVGISEEGMPLYTHGEAFLQRTSKYVFKILFSKSYQISHCTKYKDSNFQQKFGLDRFIIKE